MDLKNGKVFTSKFFETGPSSYEKRIYRAAVSQRLRNTAVEGIAQLKPDGTRWRTVGEVKGKYASGVGSQ